MTAQETSGRELLALAEALWLYEASDMPAARNARSCQVFTDQSESTQKKWTGFASAALEHLAATRAAGDAPALTYADGIEAAATLAQNYEDYDAIGDTSIGDVQHRDLRLADAIRALSHTRPERSTEVSAPENGSAA